MAEMWHPQTIEVYRSWVDAVIDEATDRLSDWELNFINDIDDRLSGLRQLTQKQAEVLENIYAKYTE